MAVGDSLGIQQGNPIFDIACQDCDEIIVQIH